MRCYKCGGVLSDSSVCGRCGADVSVYRKAARVSNAYYNLGLAKAKVRDLSGAVESLKTSIAINKRNIEARNLLGLVFCEMGDVVEALSQWVISKNIEADNNPAGSYIKKIQSNQNRFEMISNTIKKYNQSLLYAREGNFDMAVIQLKKVITQNPKLIKAQQLLALLYIKDKEYGRAKKCLNAVQKIDRNNTLTLKYLSEIESITSVKDSQGSFLPKKRAYEADTKALNGNDVIIPRASYKEPSNGAITIITILAGAVIGAALIWFLVMPARYKGLTEDYNRSLTEYSEQLSSGNVELNNITKQLQDITGQKESLEQQLSQVSGTGGSNKLLNAVIQAANSYIANDKTGAAGYLVDIDVSALPTDEAKTLYTTLATAVMPGAAADFYNKGTADYRKSSFDTAVTYFVNAYKCDKTNVNAIYYAAKCYVALNQTDKAKTYYQYIVNDFASSSYASEARNYVNSH
ncbi:MAG: tetratricopeptide repeat protein [Eubacteriales bacterium]|nr:tetratricopeptide repeat protein [Eubacteriales bacterium]